MNRRTFLKAASLAAMPWPALRALGTEPANMPPTNWISENGLTRLGTLKTKSSRQITQSRFSIGCECLDRKMWNFDKAYPHIAALGAKWARVQTGWSQCEKVKGKYDFAWLDAIVDKLLAVGIQPWFNVGYGNRHYTPDAPHETAVGWTPVYDQAARTGWENFVKALARHYQLRVAYYEVWNEPDIRPFWTPHEPSPEMYTDLVALTSRAIHSVFPKARIIGGAISDALSQQRGFSYVERCFEHGMGQHIDAFSYHLYHPTPEGYYDRQLATLRALVHRYRPGLPLWQGESGAPSMAQKGQALDNYEWDESKQAKNAARRFLLDLALDTPFISWFHASDFMFYIIKNEIVNKQYYFGLLGGGEYRPKPAYSAVQTICTLFAGDAHRTDEVNLRLSARDKADSALVADARAYAFATGYGTVIACWQPHNLMEPFTLRRILLAAWMPQTLAWKEPVLIDPLTQTVYALARCETKGGVKQMDVPLTDWPLLLADRNAIPI